MTDNVLRPSPPRTKEIANILAVFEKAIKQLDIPYYVVSSVHRDIPLYGDESIHIYSNWPRALLDHWEEKRGFSLDPITQYARTAKKPYFWSEAVKDTSKHSAFLFSIAQSYGLKEGYVVPLHNEIGDLRGGVSIGGPVFPFSPDNIGPVDKLCKKLLEELDELVHKVSVPEPQLSKQEREVLQCAARGESIQDTSRILRISDSAVKDAQSRARKKLKARNTTHACVIATRINAI